MVASGDDGQSSWTTTTTTATNTRHYEVLPLQRSVTAPGFLEKTTTSASTLNIRFGSSLITRNNLVVETGGANGNRYTSLKDLIRKPSSSPGSQSSTCNCSDVLFPEVIPIRNRLVQQAAFAYLQPRSSSIHKKKSWICPDRGFRTDGSVLNDLDSTAASSIPCVSFLCLICSGFGSSAKGNSSGGNTNRPH